MSKDRAQPQSEVPTIGQSVDTAPTLLKVEQTGPVGDTAACPKESEITALVQGLLAEDAVKSLEEHLEGCAHCAAVAAELRPLLAPEDPAEIASKPEQIGRYQVLEPLGAGGMGVVSLAYDPRLKRNIALKLLLPELKDSPDGTEARRRLLREGQALAALSHPNVLTVHDVGAWADGVFIAMEFVQGSTLTDWLRNQAPGWREVLEVFVQAGRGLEAAHGVGLVHRDVKPSNILLGDDGRVRVTDFGLATASEVGAGLGQVEDAPPAAGSAASTTGAVARENGRSAAAMALTRTGALLGTPAYMAPEQLGGQRADSRSDQFSFCVSLYEALSGRRPFRGTTLLELAESFERDPVSEAALTGVPKSIRAALLRGLSTQPVDRFDSMTSLVGELERSLDESAAPAAPRRRLSTLLSVAALLVAVSALGLWLFLRPQGQSQSGSPGQPASAPVAGEDVARSQPQMASVATPTPKTGSMPSDAMREPPRPRPAASRRGAAASRRRPSVSRRRPTASRPRPTASRRRPEAMPPRRVAVPSMRLPAASRIAAALKKAKALQRVASLQTQIFRLSRSGQGKRCLAALAELQKLAPAAAMRLRYYRATCTMLAGHCDRGKRLLRKYLSTLPNLTPANIDASVRSEAARRCP